MGRAAASRSLGAVLAVAALAATAPSVRAAGEPDLVIRLPDRPYAGQVAPVFVDAYEQPGRLLYRFDSVIANQGGTLDLFRDPGDGRARQALWPGGSPTAPPRPDQVPSGTGVSVIDLPPGTSGFSYVHETTHEHWHFSSAASYALLPTSGPALPAKKVGFCLFDSFGPSTWFGYSVFGGAGETWCGFDAPDQAVVRMGLSPGAADRYTAQTQNQWVDITDMAPGPAVLHGQANPLNSMLESDGANNLTDSPREIPGVRSAPMAAATDAGAPLALGLSGEVVAPEVPARRNGACGPSATSTACYVFASAPGPLTFRLVTPPEHGTVSLAPASGLTASATYAPAAGFAGEDSFAYTATDARGLTSAPAAVRVAVAPPASPPGRATVPASAATPRGVPGEATLRGLRAVRHRGRWRVVMTSSGAAQLAGRLERRPGARLVVRRLHTRRVATGPVRVAVGRLRPGRYLVRLYLDGRPAGVASFTERR